ncbi:MAG: hypothetical protein AAF944_26205 [Bacteroidota bacterium]
MDGITLKSSHLYISGTIAQQVFDNEPQAYLAYQAERGVLLVAPVSQQWFYKMHQPSQHLLKARNLQGDKTIALHEILIDHALDNRDRELEYTLQDTSGILKISL